MEIIWENVARFGFEAYIRSRESSPDPVTSGFTEWEQLPQVIKDAWIAAAKEISDVMARAVMA